ncbi:HSF-type DNA-binding-domain containing protein [Rhodotorula toruloides]|uniref:HSF-type DNA-binding-domain containing protein n=1 Tax=Rhodotorula toruloides TaxID=5286 RepID=A0A2T0ACW8_RHOTO|nr:HSF-type DNA-binding-domain containing protein [Rhodotorula toruloides]PRQ75856.1 HSF-type DNA-binding-domain containing protein [Rhodotorula toruloides]
MQPRDTAQKNGGVAQQPQKQPQQQEVRIQCPYTASSCPLFNPTFSVAEVLAAGSSAPPPPPSPPPKKQPTPLVPLAPPTHPSLVDSMRSACGVGVGAGGMEGEGAAGFAYTDYSIAPSPETLTRSLGSSTSGSGRGSGSPPSLSGSALYAPPPTAPTSYPPKHSPSTYTPLPFNTPSGFRLPSPETPFSPLSALEAAAFASGGAYNTYPSPRPGFGSFGTGSYGGPMSPYLNASGSTSYRPNFDSAILPPPPLPPSHSRTQQPSSCPIGLGFSAPSLDASGLPMPMPVSDLAGLEGLEGLASAAAAAAAAAAAQGGVGVGGMVGGETGRPRKRKRTGMSGSGEVEGDEEDEEDGDGFVTAVGGAVGSTSAAPAAGSSAPMQSAGAEVATPFISKLHHLLSNPSYADVIRWNTRGTSLLYSHTSPRLLGVLKRFFRHTAISSLARQLNIYAFRRLSTNEVLEELREGEKASEWTGFAHEGFWREGEGRERCELERLKPKAVKKKGEAGGGGGGKKRKKVAPAGGRKAEVLTDEEGNGEE